MELSREPRVDRARNRVRLLAAAARAIQQGGLDVPMRAIAREAGMGVATAYRHFPTKNDLIEAVLARQVEECTRAMQAALGEQDPWNGLRSIIAWFAGLQIDHPGLLRVLLDLSSSEAPFAHARYEHRAALDDLVDRARRAGAVRPTVTASTVRIGMMAMTATTGRSDDRDAAMVRTLQDILLHGIAAPPGDHSSAISR